MMLSHSMITTADVHKLIEGASRGDILKMSNSNRRKNVRSNVRTILELYPETRENSSALHVMYWLEIDKANPENFFDRYINQDLTSPESIDRSRRYIQYELGEFLPDNQNIIKKRSAFRR